MTTPEELHNSNIEVEKSDKVINISGSSSIVDTISGEGMLEKVYIPPIVSSQEIIANCDKWLEMFRKVHDKFRELVLSERYRKQNIVMRLSFSQLLSLSDKKKSKKIELNLKQHGAIIQEGVQIIVDEASEDIYAYLVANVLDYYVSKNYANSQIDYLNPMWDWALSSNIKKATGESKPMFSDLRLLLESVEYENIIINILGNHNLGKTSSQMIFNLKNKITNQQLGDRIMNSINHSTGQYHYIVSESSKEKEAPVLQKSLNPTN